MSGISSSGLRNQLTGDMISFLKNFQLQNSKDQYSSEQFFTFLEFLPLQQTSQLTLDQRAQLESNHHIMLGYLRQKLTQNGRKQTFTGGDLIRVLQRDSVDAKCLADICERQSRQDVVNTIGAFIKSQTDVNKDHQDILSYLQSFMKPQDSRY